jgi:hypothetical protein
VDGREIDVVLLGEFPGQRGGADVVGCGCRGGLAIAAAEADADEAAGLEGAGDAAGADAAAFSSIAPTTCPMLTVAPAATAILRAPVAGAGTSRLTLSVSSSSTASSRLTKSPSFLSQRDSTPLVTLSPAWGITMSTAMLNAPKGLIEGAMLEVGCRKKNERDQRLALAGALAGGLAEGWPLAAWASTLAGGDAAAGSGPTH